MSAEMMVPKKVIPTALLMEMHLGCWLADSTETQTGLLMETHLLQESAPQRVIPTVALRERH